MAQQKRTNKRLTTKEFIAKAVAKHGDRYDYSRAVYVNQKTPLRILCSVHGAFEQRPNNHLSGAGCRKCSVAKNSAKQRTTLADFIAKANSVHEGKYDYSRSEYTNSNTKITIICSEHGSFEQAAGSHLSGAGCPHCGVIERGKRSRKTLEEFIADARAVHGDRYDYSEVDYQGASENVTIICSEHGPFEQSPHGHTSGRGCQKCRAVELSERFSWTTEEFVENARRVHGDFYDYSEVDYINQSTPVIINCPHHGQFTQLPGNHISGKGCQKCGWAESANKLRGTKEKFVAAAREVHGNKYDYSQVVYQTTHDPVAVKCPKHGVFYISPGSHISQKAGCSECGHEATADKQRGTTEEFIAKAKQVHGDKFDYTQVDYLNSNANIIIVCPKHGEFEQIPYNHLMGKGCTRCAMEKQSESQRATTEEFITKAKRIHGERYDYSEVDYQAAIEKVTIVCRKHGPFSLTPNAHLRGVGCAACTESKGEVRIAELLDAWKHVYHRQWTHPDCVYITKLRFDFFIPEHNLLIEFDGQQHFKAIDLFGGEEALAETQRRDGIKNKFAHEYSYRLLRIPYWDFNDIEIVLTEAGLH